LTKYLVKIQTVDTRRTHIQSFWIVCLEAVPNVSEPTHFLCLPSDASFNIFTFHSASTPSAFHGYFRAVWGPHSLEKGKGQGYLASSRQYGNALLGVRH